LTKRSRELRLDNFREFTFYALGCIRATCLRGGDAEVAYVRASLYATRCEGKKVEAVKLVLQLGTFWDGWSQWRNRLAHDA
jgi:hypothetical protein